MLKIFFAAGTVLTLLFGAVGVGAAAAQNSQPGEPLYALKAWGEPFQFMFQAREQVQTQAMNGSAQNVSDPRLQNQLRLQTQEMFQAQQMNNLSGNGTGLQTHDRDQLHDQIQLQTQDRLHTQDCVPNPQGSAAQNQYGGLHKP